MPEVIFTGPAGRIEGRYHPARQKNAPIAIMLHPHPQFGGTMNHQIVYQLYYAFVHRGFAVLRFNFRGVGRSQGSFDHGAGELSDAASALDWAQSINPEARSCWVAGFSFGAWIGMQLLMRRPGDRGLHLGRAAREPLRLLVPGPLPVVGPHHPWRQGCGGAAQGRARSRRQAEDAEGHRDRPEGDPGREPLLRQQDRADDAGASATISTSASSLRTQPRRRTPSILLFLQRRTPRCTARRLLLGLSPARRRSSAPARPWYWETSAADHAASVPRETRTPALRAH